MATQQPGLATAFLRFIVAIPLVGCVALVVARIMSPHAIASSTALTTFQNSHTELDPFLQFLQNVLGMNKSVAVVGFVTLLLRFVLLPCVMLLVLTYKFGSTALDSIPSKYYSGQAIVVYFALYCYSRFIFFCICMGCVGMVGIASLQLMVVLEVQGLLTLVQRPWDQQHTIPLFLAVEVAFRVLLSDAVIATYTYPGSSQWLAEAVLLTCFRDMAENVAVFYLFCVGCGFQQDRASRRTGRWAQPCKASSTRYGRDT